MSAATVESEQETITLSELANELNRSIGFFNAERKEQLVARGASLGGRGLGSAIPKSLVEELKNEWGTDVKQTRTRSARTAPGDGGDVESHPDVVKASESVDAAHSALAAAEAEVARWKKEIREAGKHLTAVRRDVAKELAKAVKKPTAAERKAAELKEAEAKAERELQKIRNRIAKLGEK